MTFIKLYLLAFIVFLMIDALWLIYIAPNFYKAQIGHLMTEKPNLLAAGIFYLIFIIGVVYFVVYPAVQTGNVKELILSGMLFGFITYATYDLTNLATLKEWPIMVTVVDLAWGTFLSTSTALITYYLFTFFN